ncbi:topoisomerase DNA-binding C4 zinc finger domain-containing protein [Vibrio maerlii]
MLVERTARQGPNAGNRFLGCSGFPKCKFTRI